MPKYLSYSTSLPGGFQELNGPMPDSSMEACAIAPDGRVVFKAKSIAYVQKGKLVPYSMDVARKRRLLAETALAHYALTHPECVETTVNRVSQAIRGYWDLRTRQLKAFAQHQAAYEADKYVHGATSFGRMGKAGGTTTVEKTANEVLMWMGAMFGSPLYLPKTMNIHDHFLRIFKTLGPTDIDEVGFIQRIPGLKEALRKRVSTGPETPTEKAAREKEEREREELMKKKFPEWRDWNRSVQWQRMTRTEGVVRPTEYFAPQFRGRNDLGNVPTSDTPGILGAPDPALQTDKVLARLGLTVEAMKSETRVRGVDKFVPNFETMAPVFKQVLDDHWLNFGAGPSGTTGTLLQSAVTFAGDLAGDDLKEYVLACAAYLVAGGMHTFHEVFTTGSFLGLPYTPGKYYASLPKKFLELTEYKAWQFEFWDLGY